MRILLLEDEFSLRLSVEEFLTDLDFSVDAFETSDEAFDAVFSKNYDLLLLDVKVPGKNGFELLKELRNEGIETPAIFMTSLTYTDDMVKGYDAGCCDYIKKPFDLTELQLRVNQAMRGHFASTTQESIELGGGYCYDAKQFRVVNGSEVISLGKIEKEMMDLLVKCIGQVVSVEQFQDEIWGEYVDPANIRVQINKLRKKLPKEMIKNIRGVGYTIESR